MARVSGEAGEGRGTDPVMVGSDGGAQVALDAVGRRRFEAEGAAAVGEGGAQGLWPLGLWQDVGDEPVGDLLLVADGGLAHAEEGADSGAVVLGHAPVPVVGQEAGGRHAELLSQVGDGRDGYIDAAAREAPVEQEVPEEAGTAQPGVGVAALVDKRPLGQRQGPLVDEFGGVHCRFIRRPPRATDAANPAASVRR